MVHPKYPIFWQSIRVLLTFDTITFRDKHFIIFVDVAVKCLPPKDLRKYTILLPKGIKPFGQIFYAFFMNKVLFWADFKCQIRKWQKWSFMLCTESALLDWQYHIDMLVQLQALDAWQNDILLIHRKAVFQYLIDILVVISPVPFKIWGFHQFSLGHVN